jgi:hypothetical protein
MPEHDYHLTPVLQALENDTFLVEALFFPEVSCCGDNPEALRQALEVNAARLRAHAAVRCPEVAP